MWGDGNLCAAAMETVWQLLRKLNLGPSPYDPAVPSWASFRKT